MRSKISTKKRAGTHYSSCSSFPVSSVRALLDRRAATFLHSSVADRCPVCKASACPDVRKQIMVKGGSWRGRH
ncbi:hypothetical protein T03_18008 [Trichinella britovi]|uniref:Uncharacterized protein n=1 Tax=Trichinella britovi TaxID=45882 RepID=A0A0V0ZNY8_TRIBR|nr:hypothetical protein T03_18008 [Trichinella britovi]